MAWAVEGRVAEHHCQKLSFKIVSDVWDEYANILEADGLDGREEGSLNYIVPYC